MGIIAKLQSDSVNQSISVSELLRQVKLVASKLNLGKIEEWVDLELNGYPSLVPFYRQVRGDPRAFNPYSGAWIPLASHDPRMTKLLQGRAVGSKIAELEALADMEDENQFQIPFSAELANSINYFSELKSPRMMHCIDKSAIIGILDSVRNKILDWSLSLEQTGIRDTEESFSADAKHTAQTTYNISSIGSFIGNLGGESNSVGDIAVNKDVFETLTDALRGQPDSGQLSSLMHAVEEMKQTKSDKVGFAKAYQKFVGIAADHMSLIAPFLPALSDFFK